MGMRAMQTPLGMTLLGLGVLLVFALLASASAALIGLTLFLVRRSRESHPTITSTSP
jgi:hypothetical protein